MRRRPQSAALTPAFVRFGHFRSCARIVVLLFIIDVIYSLMLQFSLSSFNAAVLSNITIWWYSVAWTNHRAVRLLLFWYIFIHLAAEKHGMRLFFLINARIYNKYAVLCFKAGPGVRKQFLQLQDSPGFTQTSGSVSLCRTGYWTLGGQLLWYKLNQALIFMH